VYTLLGIGVTIIGTGIYLGIKGKLYQVEIPPISFIGCIFIAKALKIYLTG